MKGKNKKGQRRAMFRKINWSDRMPLNHATMKLLENRSGVYELFDQKGKRIYVGSSNVVKHRDESYVELDDFAVHPTKKDLRKDAVSIRVAYMPIDKARAHEERIKQSLKFNMDSHTNEMKKKNGEL